MVKDWKVWTERYKSGTKENIDLLFVDGNCEGKDFLEKLYEDDIDAWDKFDYIFERKCAGHSMRWKMFHEFKTVPGAFEFKAKGKQNIPWRIFCFREGNCWILTHGIKKGSDKEARVEARKSIELKRKLGLLKKC